MLDMVALSIYIYSHASLRLITNFENIFFCQLFLAVFFFTPTMAVSKMFIVDILLQLDVKITFMIMMVSLCSINLCDRSSTTNL